MINILNTVLTLILNHGYPVILGAILLAYIGIPISLNAILLAAGAFAADGTLNIFILIPLVSISALVGDIFNYYLGKYFGKFLINKYTRKIGLNEENLDKTNKYVKQWGRWSIFYTRWLLTPIGIPVNLIAGIRKYPLKKFVIFAAIGETLWALIYLILGYIFGNSWVLVWDYISDTPQILVYIILAGVLIFVTIKKLKQN